MAQINLKQLLAGDGQQEYIDKLNFNFGQISQFGGGPPGIEGEIGDDGIPGGRGPRGIEGFVGPRGSEWTVVDTDPSGANVPEAAEKDLAFNRYTGHLFAFDGTTWNDQGKLIEDGTFTERSGSVYYNLPMHDGVVKSMVLSPVDYKALNIDPLTSTFRPVIKMLSNNLSHPFLTFGAVDNAGLETPQTKQVGLYLDSEGGVYNFTVSNSSGDNILASGPNRFKVGKDHTYRFSTSGDFDRILFDLADLNERYVIFGEDGEQDPQNKLHIGPEKDTPSISITGKGHVGFNNRNPEAKLHLLGEVLELTDGSSITPAIFGANVGGGNQSKIHFKMTRVGEGQFDEETETVMTSIVRVDGNSESAYIGMIGGLANQDPQIIMGFGLEKTLELDKDTLTATVNFVANLSGTIGSRTGQIGLESFGIGNGVEASGEGSVAIGADAKSTHAGAIVVGSGVSRDDNSMLVYGKFGVKVGGGNYPLDEIFGAPTPIPYFSTQNPNAYMFGVGFASIAASIQHDDSSEGLEVVTFAGRGGGSADMSFMVTKVENDGTDAKNLFSVGKGNVTIGIEPKDPKDLDADEYLAFYSGRYGLSVDGPVLIANENYKESAILAVASIISSPQAEDIALGLIQRAPFIIKGGDLHNKSGLSRGGDIVIAAGKGTGIVVGAAGVGRVNNTRPSPVEHGNIIIGYNEGTKQGGVIIGSDLLLSSEDVLQVTGSAYFNNSKTSLIALSAGAEMPTFFDRTRSAIVGFVKNYETIDRPSIDTSGVSTFGVTGHTAAGRLGHSWTSRNFGTPTNPIWEGNDAAVHGTIQRMTYRSITYAGYFEDLNDVSQLFQRTCVKIKSKSLALSVEGRAEFDGAVYAKQFIPQRGWSNVPLTRLKVQGYRGDLTVTPITGQSGGSVILNTPFPYGDRNGQVTACSMRVFNFGLRTDLQFHIIIQSVQVDSPVDNWVITEIPVYGYAASIGQVYCYGTSSGGPGGQTEMSGFLPIASRRDGKFQIMLPPGTTNWSYITKLHVTCMMTVYGGLAGIGGDAEYQDDPTSGQFPY